MYGTKWLTERLHLFQLNKSKLLNMGMCQRTWQENPNPLPKTSTQDVVICFGSCLGIGITPVWYAEIWMFFPITQLAWTLNLDTRLFVPWLGRNRLTIRPSTLCHDDTVALFMEIKTAFNTSRDGSGSGCPCWQWSASRRQSNFTIVP